MRREGAPPAGVGCGLGSEGCFPGVGPGRRRVCPAGPGRQRPRQGPGPGPGPSPRPRRGGVGTATTRRALGLRGSAR